VWESGGDYQAPQIVGTRRQRSRRRRQQPQHHRPDRHSARLKHNRECNQYAATPPSQAGQDHRGLEAHQRAGIRRRRCGSRGEEEPSREAGKEARETGAEIRGLVGM